MYQYHLDHDLDLISPQFLTKDFSAAHARYRRHQNRTSEFDECGDSAPKLIPGNGYLLSDIEYFDYEMEDGEVFVTTMAGNDIMGIVFEVQYENGSYKVNDMAYYDYTIDDYSSDSVKQDILTYCYY